MNNNGTAVVCVVRNVIKWQVNWLKCSTHRLLSVSRSLSRHWRNRNATLHCLWNGCESINNCSPRRCYFHKSLFWRKLLEHLLQWTGNCSAPLLHVSPCLQPCWHLLLSKKQMIRLQTLYPLGMFCWPWVIFFLVYWTNWRSYGCIWGKWKVSSWGSV